MRKGDPYLPDHANWLKIRNRNYSQWVGREELLEQERARVFAVFVATLLRGHITPARLSQGRPSRHA